MIRNEKGITIMALVITMVVMVLISAPMIIHTIDLTDVSNLTKHREDFINLSETISQVYEQGTTISTIGPRYVGDTQNCTNPNDGDTYYVIDAEKLNEDLNKKYNINMKQLNYGELNYNTSGTTSSETGDVYIINEQSRNIYYLQGFKNSEGSTLYTYPQSNTIIQMQNYTQS